MLIQDHKEYIFTFNLQPIALKRHRHSVHHTWNSQRDQLDSFASLFKTQMHDQEMPLLMGPINIKFEFYFEMPPSWSKKKKDIKNGKPHDIKPDASNCQKFIEDSLNEIAYHDDCQISDWSGIKRWAYEPMIRLVIKTNQ